MEKSKHMKYQIVFLILWADSSKWNVSMLLTIFLIHVVVVSGDV